MRTVDSRFIGTWRITHMDVWAQDAVDLLGPGFFRFDPDGTGGSRFIAVVGWMDCRYSESEGKPLVEFSWLGNDERDDASGRGWAIIENDGTLKGHIFIHQADDSAFTAIRDDSVDTSPRLRTRRRR